jgi:hypothetical protein
MQSSRGLIWLSVLRELEVHVPQEFRCDYCAASHGACRWPSQEGPCPGLPRGSLEGNVLRRANI